MKSNNTTIYNISDLAKLLKRPESTIRKFLREGLIKGKKIGRSWFMTEKDLIEFLHKDPKFKNIIK